MPLFRNLRDVEFVKNINRELIERVIGEKITYYPISKKFTNSNFYGESKEKIVDPPIEIYALIDWNEQDVTTTSFGQDVIYNISVYLLKEYLDQIEVEPIEGDVIEWDDMFFEVLSITIPDQIFGKEGQDIGYELNCKTMRDNIFKISVSASAEHAARTAPDEKGDLKSFYNNINFAFSSSI